METLLSLGDCAEDTFKLEEHKVKLDHELYETFSQLNHIPVHGLLVLVFSMFQEYSKNCPFCNTGNSRGIAFCLYTDCSRGLTGS